MWTRSDDLSSASRGAVVSGSRWLAPFLVLMWTVLACGGGSVDDRLEEARGLHDVGQYGASVELLREILAADPDASEANFLLGTALYQTGEPGLALWPLEKAATDPEWARPALLLAATLNLQARNHTEAVSAATRILEVDAADVEALRIRAQAHLAAHERELALADARQLLQVEPDDSLGRILEAEVLAELGRLDEAEERFAAMAAAGAESGDAGAAARACSAHANFLSDHAEDPVRSEAAHRACLESHPIDPVVLQVAAEFFDEIDKSADATDFFRAALDEAPENAGIRSQYAARLIAADELDEAEAVLAEGAEQLGSPDAWLALSDFYTDQQRYDEALEALLEARELAGDRAQEPLRFKQVTLLIDSGDVDGAVPIAAELTDPAYKAIVDGQLLYHQGKLEAALAQLEEAIVLWPNNAGARVYAALAAQQLGQTDRAIAELAEATRLGPELSDASLLMARIHFDRGRYADALQAASVHLQERDPGSVTAHIVAARSAAKLGQEAQAREILRLLGELDDDAAAATAASERAALTRASSGAKDSLAELEAAELDLTDPVNELVLRAMSDDLLTLGRADRALALADAAVEAHPEAVGFHDVRARVLLSEGRVDDARTAWETGLAQDEDHVQTLVGLGVLAADGGDGTRAEELFTRAASADPSSADAKYRLAQLRLAAGDLEGAQTRLEVLVLQHPGHVGACNDLGWLLARQGVNLDRALELATRAASLEGSPGVLDTLGWVHLKRGEAAEALEVLERARAGAPESPDILYHLGLAQEANGSRAEAVSSIQEALAMGGLAEEEDARRQLAALQQ